MSRLEEKLKDLGYSLYNDFYNHISYIKVIDSNINIHIEFDKETDIIFYKCVKVFSIKNEQDMNKTQQAFNEMQKDLEELKKYEEEKI